jgi:GT2 family glycosyltransferase
VTHQELVRGAALSGAGYPARSTGAVGTLPNPGAAWDQSGAMWPQGVEPATQVDRGLTHELAVIVLTQSDRPAELACAIESVRAQQQVDTQLVLVVNGAPPPQFDGVDRLIVLPQNVGIPSGRNIGARVADAKLIMFLDDDAQLLNHGLLAEVVKRFDADPELGAMSIHLVDEQGQTQQRHIPRLGSGSADRSGAVTHFVGAACVVRADAFHGVEGFDPRFVYAMEESDLAWRLLDAGWSIWYSADLKAFHPRTAPSRHRGYALMTARNRVWMAWRSLPAPLLAGYLLTWTAAAILRGAPLKDVLAGYREASSALPPRRPMRWGTVARMTMLGRPPVV